ncbi:MAG: hypothetical protein Q8O59_04585 [bacterium]|nr:hypothetical protein [bacterium]
MKKMNFLVMVIAILIVATMSGALNGQSMTPPQEMKQIGLIDFSNRQAGQWYTFDMMTEDWNPRLKNGNAVIDFKGIIHNRAVVSENKQFGGNALRVFLPKGKISPAETGAQIFGYIGGREEVYFSASIFLPNNFECGKEIKIPPGIYGGWKFATGGDGPDGVNIGPSIRAVLQECRAKSYVYHLNQKGDNDDGSNYGGNPIYGDKFSWKFPDGKPVIVSKGVKHEIMFYAHMNTPGKKDGVHKVWYDGTLVLSLENLEFRKVSTLQFDTVGVEIFRGGNDQSYSTPHDNTLDVSDFKVFVKD